MIETEQQRRWWFATHPEFSSQGSGKRSKRHKDEGEPEKISPEAVDAYVDGRLDEETDPVIIQLLKSTKHWFGTEHASKSPAEQAAAWGDEEVPEWMDYEEEEDQKEHMEQPEGPSSHPAADPDSYDKYEDVLDSIERLRSPDPAKEAFIDDMMKAGCSTEWAESRWRIIKRNEEIAQGMEWAMNFRRAIAAARAMLNSALRMARVIGKPPARLPPKGTPERAKIEAARERGVKAKKAEELKDIEAGGKGSGIWSKQELEEIRKTKEFPADTVWHHDPSVANRPDLAPDPRVVHPMRGGPKAHLRHGHDMDWRNPRQ